jgi:hypothetical protein
MPAIDVSKETAMDGSKRVINSPAANIKQRNIGLGGIIMVVPSLSLQPAKKLGNGS